MAKKSATKKKPAAKAPAKPKKASKPTPKPSKPKAKKPAKPVAKKPVKAVAKHVATSAKKSAKTKVAAKSPAKASSKKPAAAVSKSKDVKKAKPEAKAEKKVYIPDVNRPMGMYGGVTLCSNPTPFPKKSPYSPKELSQLKQALLTERNHLRHELAQLEGSPFSGAERTNESSGHSVHIAEHASDMQSTETNLAVRALDEERLAQVQEALLKMSSRQYYGLCIACGDKIGIQRLTAKPHAHLCMDCQRKYERERRH